LRSDNRLNGVYQRARATATRVTLAFTFLSIGCSHDDRPRYVDWGPIHWGAAADGLQAGLAVQKRGDAAEADAALPGNGGVYVCVILRNVSNHPLKIVEPIVVFEGMGSAPPLMQAVIETTDGATHSFAFVGREVWPYIGVWNLAPGEARQMKGQSNSELWFAPWMWGVAELKGRCGVTYENDSPRGLTLVSKPKLHKEEVEGLWTGRIASGAADVDVKVPPPQRAMDRHD
jgi:hypothetical protein